MPLDEDELSNEDFDVSVSEDGAVVHAKIDRPDKGNSMNQNVMDGLKNSLDAADGSDARAYVLRGADGKFCSGGDLSEMSRLIDASPQEYREYLSGISEVMGKMRETDALTVVAVEGYCLAGEWVSLPPPTSSWRRTTRPSAPRRRKADCSRCR